MSYGYCELNLTLKAHVKMLFNSPVGPTAADQTNEWPGLYNGDVTSANYNPLGWYSYKIVVKQTEQEYYAREFVCGAEQHDLKTGTAA